MATVRPLTPAGRVIDTADLDIADLGMTPGFRGCFLIPLAEFGKSLEDADIGSWFEDFAERNKDQADYEITAQGELRVMAPTGFPGEWFEAEMVAEVVMWARTYGGRAGGPTSRFWLSDGSLRGPDAYWFSWERWRALPEEARTPPFAGITPDFLAEIVSPSNRGPELVDKVRRYLEGGARLIWVIHPRNRTVTIYRPRLAREILSDPDLLEGSDVLPGFVFNVRERIFDNTP